MASERYVEPGGQIYWLFANLNPIKKKTFTSHGKEFGANTPIRIAFSVENLPFDIRSTQFETNEIVFYTGLNKFESQTRLIRRQKSIYQQSST